jgi:hypothetical protein
MGFLTASLLLAAAAVSSTGCQITEGGQTLPSPWYIYDDIQYFAPGPEFKLSREAAAQKAYRADEAQRRLQGP